MTAGQGQRGGRIEDNACALHGKAGGRRQQAACIITNFHTKTELIGEFENEVSSHGDAVVTQADFRTGKSRRSAELPVFIAGAFAGEHALRYHAEHLAPLHHRSYIVQAIIHQKRQPHNGNQRQCGRICSKTQQSSHCSFLQARLEEQIRTAGRCDAKLREHHHLSALLRGFLSRGHQNRGIKIYIGHAHLRHCSGHTVISVRTHMNLTIFCQIQTNCQSSSVLRYFLADFSE